MKSKKKRKILPTNSSENSEQWDTFPTFGPKACIPGLGSMNDNLTRTTGSGREVL